MPDPYVVVDGLVRQGGHGEASVHHANPVLLYLQTEAVRTRSREVELGRSMNQWLTAMGIDNGGKTYKLVREQSRGGAAKVAPPGRPTLGFTVRGGRPNSDRPISGKSA